MIPLMGKIPKTQVVLLFFPIPIPIAFLFKFCHCTDPSYLEHYYCSNSTLYASNSTYQSNLNTLLSSLSSYAISNSNNAYRNATVGQNSNTVYGFYYCRGDDTSDVCSNCVNTAVRKIAQLCPNMKVAYIWYDKCTLRYSNESFFSTASISPAFSMWNLQYITDPTQFNQLLGDTMNQVATAAAYNLNRFATKEAEFTSFQNLYCLAQCSPDLSLIDCNTCLQGNINFLPTCCTSREGGRVFNPSCNIRFEMYPFYQITASAPSPSPAVLTPPPPTPSNSTTIAGKQRKSSSKIIAIVVPVAATGVILLSILLYFVVIRKKKKQDLSMENGENAIKRAESLQFDFSTILAARNNFANDNKIGEGGFVDVFKERKKFDAGADDTLHRAGNSMQGKKRGLLLYMVSNG